MAAIHMDQAALQADEQIQVDLPSGHRCERRVAARLAGRGPGSLAKLMASPEERLKALGLELPPRTESLGKYLPYKLVGNMLYVSGSSAIPRVYGAVPSDGEAAETGQVTVEEAISAAQSTCLRILGIAEHALGSINNIKRVVKSLGMVNAPAGFKEHPKIIDGYSNVLAELFGPEDGVGARSAVGMSSLPLNISVEIEVIFEVVPEAAEQDELRQRIATLEAKLETMTRGMQRLAAKL